jgi:site-specific recombinase XerD
MPRYDSRSDIWDFLAYIETAQRASVHTVKAYRKSLDLYYRHLQRRSVGVRGASVDDVASFLASMSHNAPRTVRARLSAVKAFHKWLCSTGRAPLNPADIVRGPRAPHPKRAALSKSRVDQVRAAAPTLRHRVIIALLYNCALRVSEAAACETQNVDCVRWQVTVMGKGSKQRTVPIIGQSARLDLAEYLAREQPAKYLLPSPKPGRHLHPVTVHRLLGEAAEYAGCDPKLWHPHALRHARAEHLRAKGYEPFWLQRFLGHASLSHTAAYVHPPLDDPGEKQAMLPADFTAAIQALADALKPKSAGD